MDMLRSRYHPRAAALAVALVAGLAVAAGAPAVLGSGDGGDGTFAPDGPHTVRQVFTERYTDMDGDEQLRVGETWTLVNDEGEAEAHAGGSYRPDGTVAQAGFRDASGELHYWGEPAGPGYSNCVEELPPSPRGLDGLLPTPLTDAELESDGYEPGGTRGEGATTGIVSSPEAAPIASRSYELGDGTLWTRTIGGDDGARHATAEVNDDGLIVGFWSETTRDGEVAASRARIEMTAETYPVDEFTRAKESLGLDGVDRCQ